MAIAQEYAREGHCVGDYVTAALDVTFDKVYLRFMILDPWMSCFFSFFIFKKCLLFFSA